MASNVCFDFAKGHCERGDSCKFSHDAAARGGQGGYRGKSGGDGGKGNGGGGGGGGGKGKGNGGGSGGKGNGSGGGKGKGKSTVVCRDFIANGRCPRGENCHFKHSQTLNPVPAKEDDDDEPPAGDRLWEPQLQYQQRLVDVGAGQKYTLFFPLELTNKDYMRRVLEIVALGISGPVLRITKEKRLDDLVGDSTYDAHYLLKQILGSYSE